MDQPTDRTVPADIAGSEPLEPVPGDTPPDDPQPQSGALVGSGPTVRRSWSPGDLLGVAIAAAGGAAIVLTMLVPRAGTHEASVATPAPRQSVQPAARPPALRSTPAPTLPRVGWHPANEWVGSRKKSLAFELAAASPVRMWMRQVTPVLVVRCLGGSLDAFVVTESPISMEAGRSDHTVRLAFDGQEHVEHWADSADHDGLFAPDGHAFLARLSPAQTLRIGFAPHNAPAVEAVFAVAGASELVAPLEKHCR